MDSKKPVNVARCEEGNVKSCPINRLMIIGGLVTVVIGILVLLSQLSYTWVLLYFGIFYGWGGIITIAAGGIVMYLGYTINFTKMLP